MEFMKRTNIMMIRQLPLAFSLVMTFALPASASTCQDDIAKIDAALQSTELDVDTRIQADDMRNQAVQLCGAGNDEEGLAVTAEAIALLKIE
jgi:hypothetical protein